MKNEWMNEIKKIVFNLEKKIPGFINLEWKGAETWRSIDFRANLAFFNSKTASDTPFSVPLKTIFSQKFRYWKKK